MSEAKDPERNRITARIGRVASVGANISGAVGARMMGADQQALARALRQALGEAHVRKFGCLSPGAPN